MGDLRPVAVLAPCRDYCVRRYHSALGIFPGLCVSLFSWAVLVCASGPPVARCLPEAVCGGMGRPLTPRRLLCGGLWLRLGERKHKEAEERDIKITKAR